MGYETVLRFFISLRETFWNWFAFKGINKYGKGAVVQILTTFRPTTVLLVKGSSETDFLDVYLTTSFGVCKIENTSAIGVIVLKNV